MKMIELKTINPYFTDVWNGDKPFEIRKDDRDYILGDILWLREYATTTGYSGRSIIAEVSYIIPAGVFKGLVEGYCAMTIDILQRKTE